MILLAIEWKKITAYVSIYMAKKRTTKKSNMPVPGIEPGFHRPQRCVLTTILDRRFVADVEKYTCTYRY